MRKKYPLQWSCPACGPLDEAEMAERLCAEHDVQLYVTELEEMASRRELDLDCLLPEKLEALVHLAEERLSPTHFLVVRVLLLKVTICASRAAMMHQVMNAGLPPPSIRTQCCLFGVCVGGVGYLSIPVSSFSIPVSQHPRQAKLWRARSRLYLSRFFK